MLAFHSNSGLTYGSVSGAVVGLHWRSFRTRHVFVSVTCAALLLLRLTLLPSPAIVRWRTGLLGNILAGALVILIGGFVYNQTLASRGWVPWISITGGRFLAGLGRVFRSVVGVLMEERPGCQFDVVDTTGKRWAVRLVGDYSQELSDGLDVTARGLMISGVIHAQSVRLHHNQRRLLAATKIATGLNIALIVSTLWVWST